MEKFTNEELNAGVQFARALTINSNYSNARKNSAFLGNVPIEFQEARKSGKDHFYLFKLLDGKGRKRRSIDNQDKK